MQSTPRILLALSLPLLMPLAAAGQPSGAKVVTPSRNRASAPLRDAPRGRKTATLPRGITVQVLEERKIGRSRWFKVQARVVVDGWVYYTHLRRDTSGQGVPGVMESRLRPFAARWILDNAEPQAGMTTGKLFHAVDRDRRRCLSGSLKARGTREVAAFAALFFSSLDSFDDLRERLILVTTGDDDPKLHLARIDRQTHGVSYVGCIEVADVVSDLERMLQNGQVTRAKLAQVGAPYGLDVDALQSFSGRAMLDGFLRGGQPLDLHPTSPRPYHGAVAIVDPARGRASAPLRESPRGRQTGRLQAGLRVAVGGESDYPCRWLRVLRPSRLTGWISSIHLSDPPPPAPSGNSGLSGSVPGQ